MPFTAAHPAIVLPLHYLPRRWISMTGLVVGSMAPDFEYFIRMELESEFSHTIGGLFWFNLPLGILLAFIFHRIVRNTLFDSLPNMLQMRLARYKKFDWTAYFRSRWWVVVISLLVGAGSHVLWDSFTHEPGFFVQAISALQYQFEVFGYTLPVYKLMQHGGTVVGGLAIAWAIWKIPADPTEKGHFNLQFWSGWAFLTFLIFGIRFATSLDLGMHSHIIGTGIAAGIMALVGVPILLGKAGNQWGNENG